MRGVVVALLIAVGCGRTALVDKRTAPVCPVCAFTDVCIDGACVPATATWSELAGSGTEPGIVAGLSGNDGTAVAVDTAGTIWVAAATAVGGGQLVPRVFRYDGSSWTHSDLTTSAASYMQLATAPDGTVYTAWIEGSKALRVYAFDGTQWRPVGASDVANGVNDTDLNIGNTPITVDRNGAVYVGFTRYDASGVGTICLYWLDGGAWVPYPGTESAGVNGPTSFGGAPSVAIADSGYPVVAWDYASGQKPGTFDDKDHIYLRRYDGTSWNEVGGSATGTGLSVGSNNSWNVKLVALAGEQLALAWYELIPNSTTVWHVHVRQWTGDAWVSLGDSATSASAGIDGAPNAQNPQIVADSHGRLVVAFSSLNASTADASLLAWDGTAWQQLAGSNDAGGISHLPGFTFNPGLALTADDRPVVAWAWALSAPQSRGIFVRELTLTP